MLLLLLNPKLVLIVPLPMTLLLLKLLLLLSVVVGRPNRWSDGRRGDVRMCLDGGSVKPLDEGDNGGSRSLSGGGGGGGGFLDGSASLSG